MAKVIIFDDGSDAAKVLEYECNNNSAITIDKVKSNGDMKNILEKYIEKIPKSKLNSDGCTVYVPFTMEDFIENDIDTQRRIIATKYPNIGVFYAYEFMNREALTSRGLSYGVLKEAKEVTVLDKIKENKDEGKLYPVTGDEEEG